MSDSSSKYLMDDKELLQQVKAGDYAAFTEVYNRHIKSLTHYGLKFTNDLQLVQDCLHDVFTWLWTKREQWEIELSLKNYLIKSLRTSIVHHLQKTQKISSVENPEEHYDFQLTLAPDNRLLEHERSQLIHQQITQLLQHLTARQKEMIYLRFYEGLSFEEIAQSMELSVKACYKLMARAIAALRENLPGASVLLFFLLQ